MNSSEPKFLRSSKSNPCPVCDRTKDGDCSISSNGELVLCHNNFDHAKTCKPDLWHYAGETSDRRCGKYLLKKDRTEKVPRTEQTRYFYYPARDGSPLVRVRRIDTQTKKDFSQQRLKADKFVPGLAGIDRANIPIYRYQDVQKAIARNELIFIVEGESCVDALWELGLAATCNIGGSEKWKPSDTADLKGARVVICPDRDKHGIKHAELLYHAFPEAQWLYAFPESPVWDNPPDKDGLDVVDWIQHRKLTAVDILNFLVPHPRTQENVVYRTTVSSDEPIVPDTAPVAEKNYVQKAEEALYADGDWVSIAGQLYRYNGRYYELQPDALEHRRIAEWLNTYAEEVRRGVYAYKRAKSSNINEVFQWMVCRLPVDQERINTNGLNCTNGIVQIGDDGTHTFEPHSPNQIYTYEGCEYDPNVDSADCDRLLECLDPPQREIFLRTAAAALHLKLVRGKIGNIKGLLCYGGGSNGKDTLRTALAAVLGQGMTSKTLQDFKGYDTGRKFTLAGLESSICNWASENSSAVKLDAIQSLKQFITGDPLEIERKGKDAYSYEPSSIFLGNCNELPTIASGLEAIRRRYAILTFSKTYKRNADLSKGELEADPRLKNDPEFVRSRIAPALLNKMLERLPLVLSEGIDYQSTDRAMQEAQENSRHLWAFAREAGLEYDGSSKVYIGDLYQTLERWYLENGWLTLDESDKKVKKLWESESQYDPPVKKSQDLYLRLRELFPRIERRMDTQERKGSKYIFGIKLGNSSQPSQPSYTERVSSQPSSQLSSQPSQPSQFSSQPLLKSSQPSYTERVLAENSTRDLTKDGQKGCDDGCDETLATYDGCDGCDEMVKSADFCNLLPNEMKALSINQPWASLIALGHKRYERRGVQTNYRGRIAIHATAEKRSHEEILGIAAFQEDGLLPEKLPFSAVIAIAEITDCIHASQEVMRGLTELDKRCCGSAPGGYLWKLENVQAIAPIPAKGQVGLWNWTPPEAISGEGNRDVPRAINIASLKYGDKIVSAKGVELVEVNAVSPARIYLKMAEADKPIVERGFRKAKWVGEVLSVSHGEFTEWVDIMGLRAVKAQAVATDEPDWQPGDKLLMRVFGSAKKYPVEFVRYTVKEDGSYKAIVLDEGKEVEWEVDKLIRPELT